MTTQEAAVHILLSDAPHGRELREWALKEYLGSFQLAPINDVGGPGPDTEEADWEFERAYELKAGTLRMLRAVTCHPDHSLKIERIKAVRSSGLISYTLKASKAIIEDAEQKGLL